jgi:hypothetical protein
VAGIPEQNISFIILKWLIQFINCCFYERDAPLEHCSLSKNSLNENELPINLKTIIRNRAIPWCGA